MRKMLLVLALLLSFVSYNALAQSKVLKDVKRVVLTDQNEVNGPVIAPKSPIRVADHVTNPAAGDTIGISTYDYFTNSITRDQLLWYNNNIHMAPMFRTAARRWICYVYSNGSTYNKVAVFDTVSGNSGWPAIDVQSQGGAVGTLGIVGHHVAVAGGAAVSRLAIWDGSSAFLPPATFDPYTDPSMLFVGDTIFLATSGNRALPTMYKTIDYGVSFSKYDSITRYHPNPIFFAEPGGVEVGMAKSQNEQYLAYFGTNEGIVGGGAHAYNGTSQDSCDNFWLVYSTNRGATFTGKRLAADGVPGLVSGYPVPAFSPLFSNFGHVNVAVGNNGVWHAIANGYGLDTTSGKAYFPIIYWNSTTNAWKSISDFAIDSIQDLAARRPGNAIGQSYPSISVSDDGKVLYAVWTGPQMTGGKLDTAATLGFFYQDLYHAYSTNGGTSWTYGGVLKGKKTASEAFGHAAKRLIDNGTTYKANILYLEDLAPGQSVFTGGGAVTQNPVVYMTFNVPKPVGVNDGVAPVSFSLNQNYPNPFNPATQINFTVPEKGMVTLKVFDVLGREVATLVNGVMEAGSHESVFDAATLTSGMYIYTLKAGNFTASKKMMLVK